ncbi:MAG: ABC transporter ATP-binding protein, partial [Desulfobacterales bacterium]
DIHLEDLRSAISHMPQEPVLFAGTLRDNIAFTSDTSEDRRLSEVLTRASFKEALSFREGLHTVIGEKGIILSGGQKQRTVFARTLLKEAPIFLFDDPVSQVDKETGDRLIETIKTLGSDKSIIIASHRIAAVRFADRIIVLEKGRIAASGSHNELLRVNPYYAKTFALQEMERAYHA